jgi:hypothetical protein
MEKDRWRLLGDVEGRLLLGAVAFTAIEAAVRP